MANIEQKVEESVKPIINDLGYDVYDIEYVKEGKDYFLRVFIDKPNGIDINDCEKVTNAINPILDEKDFIKEQYFLEVSSSGLERNLRKPEHFKAQIGNTINIRLFKAQDKKKEFTGILKEYNNDILVLDVDKEEIKIDTKNISAAKSVYNW